MFALVLALCRRRSGSRSQLNWRAKQFLILATVLNLIYWVVGQGFGGIFAGGATDPNAGPLFIVLPRAVHARRPDQGVRRPVSGTAGRRGVNVAGRHCKLTRVVAVEAPPSESGAASRDHQPIPRISGDVNA